MKQNMDADKFFKHIMQTINAKATIPIEHQLWTEQDVANYFQYTLEYAKRNVMVHPNFPPARQLPTSPNGERTSPRWRAKDIIDFGMAYDKNTLNYNINKTA